MGKGHRQKLARSLLTAVIFLTCGYHYRIAITMIDIDLLSERNPISENWSRRLVDFMNETQQHAINPIIQNITSSEKSFGACLIMRDDNFWFIEWLAYHYHVLPLRRLILVRDPNSITTSQHILDRWEGKIQITEWEPNVFVPSWVWNRGKKKNRTDLWYHLIRQQFFYSRCTKFLKKEGAVDWILLTDTDEFLRLNPKVHPVTDEVLEQSGHVSAVLEASNAFEPCVQIPRIQVSSIETDVNESTRAGLQTRDFLTMRWLKHNGNNVHAGKTALYLPHLKMSDVPRKADSVHRFAPDLCLEHDDATIIQPRSHLLIMHYLGTLEQYRFRTDPRDYEPRDAARSQAEFPDANVSKRSDTWYHKGRTPQANRVDYGMTRWLNGFVRSVGNEEAHHLLKDIGDIRPYTGVANQNLGEGEYFSACLLVKDDNHFLIEWLSYHYHVLSLRHLSILQDPTSATSPFPILDRWKNRINIQQFSDSVIPKWIQRKHASGNISEAGLHRYRQQFFYGSCLTDFQKKNMSWIALVDTDEFIRINHRTKLDGASSLATPGLVLKYLQANRPDLECLHVPRLQISSRKSNSSGYHLPAGLDTGDGSSFLTTDWLYHNGKEIHIGHNLDGKNILNLRNLREVIPRKVSNVHKVLESCPATDGDRLESVESLLVVYHYLGSYEQYMFRDDPRDNIPGRPKREEQWHKAGQTPAASIHDDTMGAWIEGFARDVGIEEASMLLEGTGIVNKG